MACVASSFQGVNLENVINPLTGTGIGQTVACGYLTDTTPFVDDNGLIHLFANLNVHYDVSVTDYFGLTCTPGVPLITPVTPVDMT